MIDFEVYEDPMLAVPRLEDGCDIIAIAGSSDELIETRMCMDVLGYIRYKEYSWAIGRMFGSTPELLVVLKRFPTEVSEYGYPIWPRYLPEKDLFEDIIKHKLYHHDFGTREKCEKNLFVFEWMPDCQFQPRMNPPK